MPAPLVLLHGFTQTGASWDAVRGQLALGDRPVLTPDQRGHGSASEERPILLPAMAADAMAQPGQLEAAHAADPLAQLDRTRHTAAPLALGGYSMGGRAALLAAIASPGRVTHLALISTTAGLDHPDERAARRAADDELADWIDAHSAEEFADRWGAGPLFAGQPAEIAAAARADRLRSTPAGLAASLRGAGTGTMLPLWDSLDALTMPVLVLVGERDEKFRAIGERLASLLPDATYEVVPGAGHQLPLEAPAAVADALTRLLTR